MGKYELKFMFDWGSGVCVWSTNAAPFYLLYLLFLSMSRPPFLKTTVSETKNGLAGNGSVYLIQNTEKRSLVFFQQTLCVFNVMQHSFE